jgi:uncharacterized protein YdeI (BOF family)
MKNFVCSLLAVASLLPLSAQARPYHLTSVHWIVATRNKITYDDRYVTIVGHVTRRMGDEEYWFTDGTGSVRLDSENFDLPIGRRIVVGGRIDQAYLGFGHIEVDVRAWHYAPLRKPVAVITHRSAPPIARPRLMTTSSTTTATTSSAPPLPPATNTAPTLAPPPEAH